MRQALAETKTNASVKKERGGDKQNTETGTEGDKETE